MGEIGEYIDIQTGKLKLDAQIPDEIRGAIEKLEYDGKGRARVGIASKNKALELLGRHFAFLKDDDKTGVTLIFQQGEKDGLI